MENVEIIRTEFAPITVKAYLVKKLEQGDKETINKFLRELDRLEAIIKDYEMAFNAINSKQESKIFKTSEL